MHTSILFKVPGKPSTSPLVILTGPALAAEFSTPIIVRVNRALSSAWTWTRRHCAPRHIVRALFSARVSTAVAVMAAAAMWWHGCTIADTLEAQRAVGVDGLLAMPWAVVWAFRTSRTPKPEKGGKE